MASTYNISSAVFGVESIISSAIVLASYVCFELPLSFYVLYLGFLQWKSKRTEASWSIGHSDFSTYNLVFMEFLGFAGFVLVLHAKISKDEYMFMVGSICNKLPWFGQLLFPIFTSVEQYLAVVRPMIYLNLKRTKGRWIRNVSTSAVWLLCLGGTSYTYVFWQSYTALLGVIVSHMFFSLVAMVFCCVSVLHVLVQPKPGVQNKSRFDKSKTRAVCVIVAVVSTLLLRFVGSIVVSSLCFYSNLWCAMIGSFIYLLNVCSSEVFFLLYLERAGKLANWKRNIDSV